MIRRQFSPTLAFYLGRRYFGIIFLTTLIVSGFVLLMDVVELMRRLANRPEIDNTVAMELALMKLPNMLLEVTPFAILLGTLVCFSKLSKNHELTAIRAIGMPARQFLIPPMVVCLGIGLFNIGAVNPAAAVLLKSYEKRMDEIFPGSTQGLVTKGGNVWLRQKENNRDILIYAKEVAEEGRQLSNTTMFVFDKEGVFKERIDAESARLDIGWWQLKDVLRLRPSEPSERNERLRLATTLEPNMIKNSFTSPNTIPIWELRQFVQLLEETGFPSQEHKLHLQRSLAMPALILAMFLLAAPFALHFSRNRGVGAMLLLGLCFGFVFRFFTDLVSTYGLAGRIDIVLAAWIPTLIAALLGLSFMLHFREE